MKTILKKFDEAMGLLSVIILVGLMMYTIKNQYNFFVPITIMLLILFWIFQFSRLTRFQSKWGLIIHLYYNSYPRKELLQIDRYIIDKADKEINTISFSNLFIRKKNIKYYIEDKLFLNSIEETYKESNI
jgi:hypothetical protein